MYLAGMLLPASTPGPKVAGVIFTTLCYFSLKRGIVFPHPAGKGRKNKNEENRENRVFGLKNTGSGVTKTQNADFGILALFCEAGNKRGTRFCTKMSLFH
jgi:hypothetical protein